MSVADHLYSTNQLFGGRRSLGHVKRSQPGLPLISIITPVCNAKNDIEKNINEVQRQTYGNIEHIIIDGGSTDGTIDILTRKNNEIDFWISETDAGIYDAMNKGIDAAKGEWVYFLGADDHLYSHDTLASILGNAPVSEDIVLLYGNILYPGGGKFISRFDKKIYLKNTVHHQGAFYRRTVFDKFRFGLTESSGSTKQFSISGDYQLNLHLFVQEARHQYVDEIICKCGKGISMEGRFIGYLEEIMIRHSYVHFYKALFFDMITLGRYGWKKIAFCNNRKL